ncbi:uncharacterized protein LOC126890236 [Diabrotica virgifera virgifera]|uniref:Protein ALP1-like n=1 Tax=Diabrotica virgifera virgifera TaxID=50390 RepID=A0ABM5KXZ6_DIAVI|nr:uncharacterized protein LOC126890236 [Diabrotica virgifera virgifera]
MANNSAHIDHPLQEIAASITGENSVSVAVQTDLTIEHLCLTYNVLSALYEDIGPLLSSKKALSPFQQLLLTFMKLRLNLPFKYISYTFCISPTTTSETFLSTLKILYLRLKHFVCWPSREQLRKNVPACFKEAFGNQVTVIIDCFEVFTETPSTVVNASQCWSNYKHLETVKFLIGITPQGTISYVSQAWGGRTSDKYLTENSDFFKLLLPGDVVLADRGFLVEDSIKILGAKLIIPAFTKGKSQLHPKDLEGTRNISTVRIHVERIIGLLKKKFKVFHQTIPISMLARQTVLDEMVIVCSALINLCDSQIPKD